MTSWVTMIALTMGGFFVGYLLQLLTDWVKWKDKKKKVAREFLGEEAIFTVAETFYFTTLFSIPISGNIPIFIIVIGLLLYALYGQFGAGKLKPKKPEDEVLTKWFTGYP